MGSVLLSEARPAAPGGFPDLRGLPPTLPGDRSVPTGGAAARVNEMRPGRPPALASPDGDASTMMGLPAPTWPPWLPWPPWPAALSHCSLLAGLLCSPRPRPSRGWSPEEPLGAGPQCHAPRMGPELQPGPRGLAPSALPPGLAGCRGQGLHGRLPGPRAGLRALLLPLPQQPGRLPEVSEPPAPSSAQPGSLPEPPPDPARLTPRAPSQPGSLPEPPPSQAHSQNPPLPARLTPRAPSCPAGSSGFWGHLQ